MAPAAGPGEPFSEEVASPPPACIIPGSELLKRLLGVLVTAADSRLRKGTLSRPGDRAGAMDRGPEAHAGNPRGGAHEGHCCSMAEYRAGEAVEGGWARNGEEWRVVVAAVGEKSVPRSTLAEVAFCRGGLIRLAHARQGTSGTSKNALRSWQWTHATWGDNTKVLILPVVVLHFH